MKGSTCKKAVGAQRLMRVAVFCHQAQSRLKNVLSGLVIVVAGLFCSELVSAEEVFSHGISMHGKPALPPEYTHFSYVNPDAPKGGKIVYAAFGSFDSVNPFILKGQKVRGLREALFGNNVYESLLVRSRDEPFSMYGLLAEKVHMPDDRSSIEFVLNPRAAFSDGHPVDADDVIFSVNLLAEKGRPNYRRYYASVKTVQKTGDRSVKFVFKEGVDRELPLLISLMPILPEHAIDPETFDQTTLVPIIGSGPYRLTEVEQGSFIVLKRNPDYWARDLPAKRGFDNYDEIRIDYYRDGNTLFEAFKKGLVDVYFDGDPNNWKEGYKGRGLEDGHIVQSVFKSGAPRSMRAYAFNTRRKHLQDKEVRHALSMLFDFEWINANLFNGGFTRTASFFQGSELSALGIPASDAERVLLAPYLDEVSDAVLNGTYQPTKTDGSGRDRKVLREALTILRSEGYVLKDGVLRDANGTPLRIELIHSGGSTAARLAGAYQRNLRNLGIELIIRQVDAAQFEERRKSFDFDMIAWTWSGSLSPGNEQYFRWSTAFADQQGSFNFPGIRSKGVDAMIDALLAARKREDFTDAVRALDRLLMSGNYVLPHYHLDRQLIAHSARIGIPDNTSLYGTQPSTWWIKEVSQ